MRSDLTQGPIRKKILLFAVPLLLSSLIQQLYNTVDLIFVGNFIGKSASSAIGVSSLLVTCLVGFFSGMSVGSSVVVSHLYGSKDKGKLYQTVHTAVALSFVGGILLMLLGYFLAPHYLKLINTPVTLQADAVSYLRIYFVSLISVMTYNIGSGVLRALGDSYTPLYAQIVGGIMNVLANTLFIVVFDFGITGAAWATMISQSFAAAIVLYKLTKLDSAYALRLPKIKINWEILKRIIQIGIPAGMQSLVITFSNVMAQFQINSLGENQIAAFTAYFKVELIIYLPIVAIGQAAMTFVGQNIGAKNYERVHTGTRQILIMGMILIVPLSLGALAMGPILFRVFTNDVSVIDLGLQIIQVTFPFYFIYPILQVLGDSLRGMGKVHQPMLIVLINICIIRTILLFIIVPRYPDIRGVAVTYPITWGLTSVCMVAYYLYHKKRSSINLAK